jgi:cellulose synthase/poly-beta-1,6-N-acetylglucosamine synthase-like glycosyltransferase
MEHNVGKATMLGRVVPQAAGEIVVLSDASSELEPDALRELMQPFADPTVGCVSGLYRLRGGSDLRAQGEGLYWRYETFIKRQESRLHSILGAHGAFYAIRKALFQPLAGVHINDDYLIPMRIVAQGMRAVYEPRAVAWERELASMEGEFARRRRIAAGNCQQIIELVHLLNPLRGWVAFSFVSHQVLRTLAPIFMIVMLMTTVWLPHPVGMVMALFQAALYGSALAGYWCQQQGRSVRWLSPPLYFCLGNLAMLSGLLKFCFQRRTLGWERAR